MLISDADCTELFDSEGAVHTGAVDKSVGRASLSMDLSMAFRLST